jgi:hypothetical protein
MQAIGERLLGLRKARGLTQEQAAQRAGLSRSTLHRAEKGDNPTALTQGGQSHGSHPGAAAPRLWSGGRP